VNSPSHRIDIVSLKNWASSNLLPAPHLRSLIITEKDELDLEEFIVKIDIWAKLLAEETRTIKT
jgi:hypothetical protein